jgi:hypothetical protein
LRGSQRSRVLLDEAQRVAPVALRPCSPAPRPHTRAHIEAGARLSLGRGPGIRQNQGAPPAVSMRTGQDTASRSRRSLSRRCERPSCRSAARLLRTSASVVRPKPAAAAFGDKQSRRHGRPANRSTPAPPDIVTAWLFGTQYEGLRPRRPAHSSPIASRGRRQSGASVTLVKPRVVHAFRMRRSLLPSSRSGSLDPRYCTSSRGSASWVGTETPASVQGAGDTRPAPGDCTDSSLAVATLTPLRAGTLLTSLRGPTGRQREPRSRS